MGEPIHCVLAWNYKSPQILPVIPNKKKNIFAIRFILGYLQDESVLNFYAAKNSGLTSFGLLVTIFEYYTLQTLEDRT